MADEWWDPRGKMAVLHKFNPVRLGYIRDAACKAFDRNPKQLDCLKGLRILDIGCGGGVLSEPLARLGASIVGADPAERNIAVAKLHAAIGVTDIARPPSGRRWRALRHRAGDGRVVSTSWKLFVQRCQMVKPGG